VSDEELDNSFCDLCSEDESSSEESVESEEQEEEEGDESEMSPDSPVKKKKPLSNNRNKSIFEKIEEAKNEKPKKIRRCVMNIACTEYDIIEKVAKRLMNFRIKEFEEDHDGAIVNG